MKGLQEEVEQEQVEVETFVSVILRTLSYPSVWEMPAGATSNHLADSLTGTTLISQLFVFRESCSLQRLWWSRASLSWIVERGRHIGE